MVSCSTLLGLSIILRVKTKVLTTACKALRDLVPLPSTHAHSLPLCPSSTIIYFLSLAFPSAVTVASSQVPTSGPLHMLFPLLFPHTRPHTPSFPSVLSSSVTFSKKLSLTILSQLTKRLRHLRNRSTRCVTGGSWHCFSKPVSSAIN